MALWLCLQIPNHVAIKIALELKKLLIDNSLLDVYVFISFSFSICASVVSLPSQDHFIQVFVLQLPIGPGSKFVQGIFSLFSCLHVCVCVCVCVL